MRDISFDYIIKTKDGTLEHCPYSLEQIEDSTKLTELRTTGRIVAKRKFTGLKDKNGKPVYEGDIVTHTIGLEIGIVKWWKGSFRVDYSQSPAVGKTYYGIHAHKFLEVIGDIYTTPELLK